MIHSTQTTTFTQLGDNILVDLLDSDTFSVQVLVSGDWVGGINFEGSLDGVTWFGVQMESVENNTKSTWTAASGLWCSLTATYLRYARFIVADYTSGTADIVACSSRVDGNN